MTPAIFLEEQPLTVFSWGENNFLWKSTDRATYQYAYFKYLSSHSFSLILPENILSKKIKFLKEYQYFDKEGEEGKLHAMVCKILRQQSLHDDNIFSFTKNEVHSQFSIISLLLIITKNIRNIQQHIHRAFEVIHFSDFIEKNILLQSYFPYKISIFWQSRSQGRISHETLVKQAENKSMVKIVWGSGLHFIVGNIKHLCLRLKKDPAKPCPFI